MLKSYSQAQLSCLEKSPLKSTVQAYRVKLEDENKFLKQERAEKNSKSKSGLEIFKKSKAEAQMLFDTKLPTVTFSSKSSKRPIFEKYKNIKKQKFWSVNSNPQIEQSASQVYDEFLPVSQNPVMASRYN